MGPIKTAIYLILALSCSTEQKFGSGQGDNSSKNLPNFGKQAKEDAETKDSQGYKADANRGEDPNQKETGRASEWQPLLPPVNVAGSNLVGSNCEISDVFPANGSTDLTCRLVDAKGRYFNLEAFKNPKADLVMANGSLVPVTIVVPRSQKAGSLLRLERISMETFLKSVKIQVSAVLRESGAHINFSHSVTAKMLQKGKADEASSKKRSCLELPGAKIRVEVFPISSGATSIPTLSPDERQTTEVCPDLLSSDPSIKKSFEELGILKQRYLLRITSNLDLESSQAGLYHFGFNVADGAILKINGQLVLSLDKKVSDSAGETKRTTSPVSLTEGENTLEMLQFNSSDSSGVLVLNWTKFGGSEEVIPAEVFSL